MKNGKLSRLTFHTLGNGKEEKDPKSYNPNEIRVEKSARFSINFLIFFFQKFNFLNLFFKNFIFEKKLFFYFHK